MMGTTGTPYLNLSVLFDYIVTLPETNTFAPENGWLEDEISFWDGLFSGASC